MQKPSQPELLRLCTGATGFNADALWCTGIQSCHLLKLFYSCTTHLHLKFVGRVVDKRNHQACELPTVDKRRDGPKVSYVRIHNIQLPKVIEVNHAVPESFRVIVPLHIDSQAGNPTAMRGFLVLLVLLVLLGVLVLLGEGQGNTIVELDSSRVGVSCADSGWGCERLVTAHSDHHQATSRKLLLKIPTEQQQRKCTCSNCLPARQQSSSASNSHAARAQQLW